jgi:hypothetical protein
VNAKPAELNPHFLPHGEPVACDCCDRALTYGDKWKRFHADLPFALLPYVVCRECGDLNGADRGDRRAMILRRARRFGVTWERKVARMLVNYMF